MPLPPPPPPPPESECVPDPQSELMPGASLDSAVGGVHATVAAARGSATDTACALADHAAERPGCGCAVCLELLCRPTMVVPCGHVFCEVCIRRATNSLEKAGRKPTCPLCRRTFLPAALARDRQLEEKV